ncbi:hypothetical protein N7492_009290 [Penicillium capsulatum]|uniref:Anaphase-promoting complex, subunit 15/MND2 n=1 Tax=Penicillium capsulatum TaxID=69766 RepID=A0A9W9HTR4_9EURO|nr:hypothetical protein N7492_009290 [Penicillium capsulatum]KAJ6106684.1 hypothetical protein N7512_010201 [Penicillium capsulatum]
MLSLPSITPSDFHELWFADSQPSRSSPQQPAHDASTNHHRRNATPSTAHRAFMPSRAPGNSLAALLTEERTLRVRKQNIATFGYSWIRPAGCAKTMLGMKEEEAEREEALAAQAAEMGAADAEGMMEDDTGMTRGEGEEEEEEEGMERDLDDEIPDADAEGLVEEGEEGLEEQDIGDEEGYLERDLDDDIPEGYPEDDYDDEGVFDDDEEEDFDNQPDLDAEIPVAGEGEGMSEGLSRDLDDEIPDAAEDGSEQEGEWQHTDTEEELDDEEDDENHGDSVVRPRFTENFRTSTPNSRGGLPPPPIRRERETDAQRRFLQRWSGGGDALDSSSLLFEEDDLRASVTSQSSRRSGFGRRFPRHVGGPRDSLN